MQVFGAVLCLALYTGLLAAANADADPASLEALRQGDMRKLALHAEPQAASDAALTALDGAEHRLSDWRGKHVLVNFWATWCAPCRKEMPGLQTLQSELGGDAFAVVTVATGRNSPQGIRKFFEETAVTDLPVLLDPRQVLSREMAVLGLPVTVILDPDGREIGRLIGEADWASAEARALLAALTGAEG